ncbi:MAG TPA: hypothetical protein VFE05_10255 [Longimicrobiaceae bacterium]|nr:hypothetical protein [Longimicrobiaceae bacterium]
MIKPNVRASFGRREAELLVALGGPGAEELLRERGLDALLDDARMLSAILRGGRVSAAPAPLVFYLLVRHALLQREISDRQLADYTAAVLLEFGTAGRANAVDGGEGEPFFYLADILAALDRARGEREFLLRVHLGNYALWLAGVFPDHVTHRVQRRGAPPLSYYDELGAAGFRTAAGSDLALRHGLGDLFVRAADQFADLRVALNSLSDALFFPGRGGAVERVLRQVADDFARNQRGAH